MNKLFLTVNLLLLAVSSLCAQQIKGVILERGTKNPIPYATVKLKVNQIVIVANANGEFIVQNSVIKVDTLEISSLGFITLKVLLSSLSIKPLNTFELEESTNTLEEVVVKPVKITSILNEAFRKSDSAYNSPVLLKGYYREFVKRDSFLTKYADGLVSYLITKKGKGWPKIDLYVEESRAKILPVPEEEDKFNDMNSPLSIEKMGEFANPARPFITDSSNYKNYVFKLIEVEGQDKSIYVISFEPAFASNKTIYHGKIYIDRDKMLILGFDYSMAPISASYFRKISLLGITVAVTSGIFSCRYQVENNFYNLSYVSKDFGLKISSKRWNQMSYFKSEFFVNKIETKDLKPIGDDYNKKALYKRGNNYKTEFWKNKNVTSNTKEET